jgi:hypothetical protein
MRTGKKKRSKARRLSLKLHDAGRKTEDKRTHRRNCG